MYAVEPALVREHAERLSLREIEQRLLDLPGEPRWVTLSGGNPALMIFTPDEVERYFPYRVSVETQGSIWRDWLAAIDHLTVSPKPPSSGMVTQPHMKQLAAFLRRADLELPEEGRRSLKVVVFDETDYLWARNLFSAYADRWPNRYLSVGTPPTGQWGSDDVLPITSAEAREQVSHGYATLAERVANDPAMRDVRVFPQLHVLAWGHARGV